MSVPIKTHLRFAFVFNTVAGTVLTGAMLADGMFAIAAIMFMVALIAALRLEFSR